MFLTDRYIGIFYQNKSIEHFIYIYVISIMKSVMMVFKKKLLYALTVSVLFSASTIAAPELKQPPKNFKQADAAIFDAADVNAANLETLEKQYKSITKEVKIMNALELMKGTMGSFSRDAILGNNLSGRNMKIEFKNLAQIKPEYSTFDALGWKKSGRLYIYINEKHKDAPAEALASLLSHEALHQDEFDSLNEETYAWTMEAAVWYQLSEKNTKLENISHPLVYRENMLKKLFVKGDFTDKYIRRAVFSNPGYKNLPTRSPGYEDENL